MRKTVEKVMARYGTDMKWIRNGEERNLRGFFRAVNTTEATSTLTRLR